MELKGEIFNWHILAHPQTPRKIQMRVRRWKQWKKKVGCSP
jgi:hypothetical protein